MDARMVDRLRRLPPEVLGDRIKSARIAKGLTQLALAKGDVTISFVSRIESGKRRLDPTLLERFAERLDQTVDDLLADEVDASVPSAAQVEIAFADLALRLGDATGALTQLDAVLAGAEPLTASDRARTLLVRARALEASGDVLGAVDVLEVLAADVQPVFAVSVGTALSRCYRAAGDLTRAVTTGESLLATLVDLGLGAGAEALELTAIVAAVHAEQGDPETAADLCRRTLAQVEAAASAHDRAAAYGAAGRQQLDSGDATSAVALANRAQSVLDDGADARALGRLRTELGAVLLRLDEPDLAEAATQLASARDTLRVADGDGVDVGRTEVALARGLFLEKKYAEAEAAALASAEELGDQAPLLAAEALFVAGRAAAEQRDDGRAQQHLRSVVERLTEVGSDRAAGSLWMDVGDTLTGLGDAEGAAQAYRSAAASTGLLLRTPARVPSKQT